MRRGYLLYLEDILTSAGKILKYAKDISYEDLIKDEMRLNEGTVPIYGRSKAES